jgi:hypothetical protein
MGEVSDQGPFVVAVKATRVIELEELELKKK